MFNLANFIYVIGVTLAIWFAKQMHRHAVLIIRQDYTYFNDMSLFRRMLILAKYNHKNYAFQTTFNVFA